MIQQCPQKAVMILLTYAFFPLTKVEVVVRAFLESAPAVSS